MKAGNMVRKAVLVMVVVFVAAGMAAAATNEATDPGGGGIVLQNSGLVTINALSALQLVKQVYDVGGTCLASSPSDASCNSGASNISVPVGTTLQFMIFVRNPSAVTIYDMRIEDQLDNTATGFAYVPSSIRTDASQNGSEAAANIYSAVAAANTLLDTVGAPLPDDTVSMVPAGVFDRLTVGAANVQTNLPVDISSNRTFAVLFRASKK